MVFASNHVQTKKKIGYERIYRSEKHFFNSPLSLIVSVLLHFCNKLFLKTFIRTRNALDLSDTAGSYQNKARELEEEAPSDSIFLRTMELQTQLLFSVQISRLQFDKLAVLLFICVRGT